MLLTALKYVSVQIAMLYVVIGLKVGLEICEKLSQSVMMCGMYTSPIYIYTCCLDTWKCIIHLPV